MDKTIIQYLKQYLMTDIQKAKAIIIKKITPIGNGSHIALPKKYENKFARVFILDSLPEHSVQIMEADEKGEQTEES